MNHNTNNHAWRTGMTAGLLPMLLLLGCDGADVTRKADLLEMRQLPTGETALTGATLLVTVSGLQPLGPGYRYVVWAATDASALALGEVAAADELAADLVSAGLSLGGFREVLVTEEEAGGALPTNPSLVVLLRGLPGSQLMFAPTALITPTSGTLEIEDHHVHCTVEGLPSLPSGLYYGVWAAIAATDAEGHANILAKSGGHGDEATVLELIGRLDLTGTLETESEHQVQMTRELFVTLESENGADEISPIVLLHATVELPEAGGDHGGGHLH